MTEPMPSPAPLSVEELDEIQQMHRPHAGPVVVDNPILQRLIAQARSAVAPRGEALGGWLRDFSRDIQGDMQERCAQVALDGGVDVEVYRAIRRLPVIHRPPVIAQSRRAATAEGVGVLYIKPLEWTAQHEPDCRLFRAEALGRVWSYGTDTAGNAWWCSPTTERNASDEDAARTAAEGDYLQLAREQIAQVLSPPMPAVLLGTQPALAAQPAPAPERAEVERDAKLAQLREALDFHIGESFRASAARVAAEADRDALRAEVARLREVCVELDAAIAAGYEKVPDLLNHLLHAADKARAALAQQGEGSGNAL